MMSNGLVSLAYPRGKQVAGARFKTMVYLMCLALVLTGVTPPVAARAQVIPVDPQSLKETPVPVPMAAVHLKLIPEGKPLSFQPLTTQLIKKQNPKALARLGKALFWDMQVGSDGVMACASCHFNAGTDVRSKNQVSPGLADTNFRDPVQNPLGGDNSFGNSTCPFTANDPNNPMGPLEPPDPNFNVVGRPQFGPNCDLIQGDFSLNGWFNPTSLVPRGPGVNIFQELDNVDGDTNDVIGSQGVRRTQFGGSVPGKAVELGTPLPDIFNVLTPGKLSLDGRVRRVTGRNAPTTINAVFNFNNFWDGRASFIFNGVNPFGFRDRTSTLKRNIYVNQVPTLLDVFVRVTNSSLASQAVGPPLSDMEMSWAGRTFPDLGKKLLTLKPLAKQLVHPQDSVLGPWSKATLDSAGNVVGQPGVNIPGYANMIRDAFQETWWNSTELITVGDKQYTQMEYNFSLFWGLAVQAYEATLVSDDTPFDRFMGAPTKNIPPDPNALTDQERLGLGIFVSTESGKCNNCHIAPIFTGHTVLDTFPDAQGVPVGFEGIIEGMTMADGAEAMYDHGMYNISVRRTTEDLGEAGTAPDAPPFRNPLDGNKPFPLSYVELAALKAQGKLPPDVARFVPTVPVLDRRVTRGAFKVPNLRNIKFTGPYFHNGDSATLRQVVEFYTRGGNFPNTNFHDFTVDIEGIPDLMFPEFDPNAKENVEALVAFLANGLTDQRVALEKAPFDHPQLFIPNGCPDGASDTDNLLELKAVGSGGRPTPIPTFLNLDPQDSGP